MNIDDWFHHADHVLGNLKVWEAGQREDPSPVFSWFRNGVGPNSPRGKIRQMKVEDGKVWFRNEIKATEYSSWSWIGDVERTRSIFSRLLNAATLDAQDYNRPAAKPAMDLNQPEMRCSGCGALGAYFCGGCRAEQRGDF